MDFNKRLVSAGEVMEIQVLGNIFDELNLDNWLLVILFLHFSL